MQIEIKSQCLDHRSLGFDYLYSLHATIMKSLTATHPELAQEIHDGIHKDRAKLICFSPFNGGKAVAVKGEKRKQLLLGGYTWFRIASPIPEFLNALGESLLRQRQLQIDGKAFSVQAINMIAPPEFKEEMVWHPAGSSASIVTAWTSRGGRKRFIRPGQNRDGEPPVEQLLRNNLITKFKRIKDIRDDIASSWLKNSGLNSLSGKDTPVEISLLPYGNGIPFKKVSTKNKNTVIYSWRSPVKVTAPIPLQRSLWSCGLGSMNFQGFGLMQGGKSCS